MYIKVITVGYKITLKMFSIMIRMNINIMNTNKNYHYLDYI